MSKLVIRHGRSEANVRDGSKDEKPAFGAPLAKLEPEGRDQAKALGSRLQKEHGLVVTQTPVAISTFKRTEETAELAGFTRRKAYHVLGEVDHGLSPTAVREVIARGAFPPASHKAAVAVLENPPAEGVWVTHGLLIAAICDVLGVKFERFIPHCCEIRELPI